MAKSRLYTYAEKRVPGLVRRPKDPFMAAGYASGLPNVNAEVHYIALAGLFAAEAALEAHHSDQARSSHPRIELVKGDRTDYHINLVVEAEDEDAALAAAYSIEYGRRGYRDRRGRWQPETQGVGALMEAMLAMGGGFA